MIKVLENEIIEAVLNNEIVVMPTDTVYGLMIKATQENEWKVNEFKHRDRNTKVSIIFPSIEELINNIDVLDKERLQMILDYLPGKYTFIVNLKESFYKPLGFTRKDYGVRVTSCGELQKILQKTGPVLATSCNYSKEDICTSIEDIERIFNNQDIKVYYTGSGENIPSTIIDLTKEKISTLR